MALGEAGLGAGACRDALEGGGNADARPYFVLALGLAARKADAATAKRLRTYLLRRFERVRERESGWRSRGAARACPFSSR